MSISFYTPITSFFSRHILHTSSASLLRRTTMQTFTSKARLRSEAELARSIDQGSPSSISFDSVAGLDKGILKALKTTMKFKEMSSVQQQVLPLLLDPTTAGTNLLVQAKTGTGKTVAFMIPIIQSVLDIIRASNGQSHRRPKALIISPTRELAHQIRDETIALVSSVPVSIRPKVCAIVGGISKKRDDKIFETGCDILVATPGRLKDHLSTNPSIFREVTFKVYDEADRLLDDGFAREITDITRLLKMVTTIRQVLMFSATVRPDVEKVAQNELGPGYQLIRTSAHNEVPTHMSVPQSVVIVDSLNDHIEALLAMLKAHCEDVPETPFKAIVFMRTGKEVKYFGNTFSKILARSPVPVHAISSRLSQNARTQVLEKFKTATSAILIASDVVARGVDVKDVSHVFQVGMASDPETYIHRVGRTGRAGKSGKGILILSQQESAFHTRLLSMNIKFEETMQYHSDPILLQQIQEANRAKAETHRRDRRADDKEVYEASSTVISQLGYYRGAIKGMTVETILKSLCSRPEVFGIGPGEKFPTEKSSRQVLKTKLRASDAAINTYFRLQ